MKNLHEPLQSYGKVAFGYWVEIACKFIFADLLELNGVLCWTVLFFPSVEVPSLLEFSNVSSESRPRQVNENAKL